MNTNIIKRIIQVLLSFVLISVILFVAAGDITWPWAWILVSANVIILLINMIALPAEVIEERGRKKENVKKWDRVLSFLSIVPALGTYIVAGLDYRFYWSMEIDGAIHTAALVLYVSGSLLVTWSMVSNRFFSTMVRLQTDRGHTVATGGPYAVVRHPGYVGFIVTNLSVPLVLGSLYGLMVSVLSMALMIIRTSLEDRTLLAELNGYAAYAQRVKYRLVPHLW